MLPGFNHNIRYKDRVFHVQTEDTGLSQPFLVTQVFIGGHLVAIEKSSYADVLDGKPDHDVRNEQIRSRMQDQHKRLLRNLVKHEYDDRIAVYLGSPADTPSPPPPEDTVPVPVAEAPIRPVSVEQLPKEGATMPVADELPDQHHSPTSGIVEMLTPLIQDDEIDDDDLFKVFDEELQKQVPWSPSNQQGALPPLDPELFDPGDLVDTIPPERAPPRRPPKPPPVTVDLPRLRYPDRTSPDTTLRPANSSVPRDRRPRPPPESPTEVGRKPPPIADTLVDFGLPAALKEQLGQAKAALEQARKKAQEVGPPTSSRKSDPRVARFRMPRTPSPMPRPERETQIDLALRRRASSTRNSRVPASANGEATPEAETLLDVNAGEIQEYIARKKKERAEKTSGRPGKDQSWGDQVDGAPQDPDADSKRPNIVVVERSLDEVILSYLADED